MKLTWRSDTPPKPGWYNASNFKREHTWRWWDGEQWSFPVSQSFDSKTAGFIANRKYTGVSLIYWNDRWPENPRNGVKR